MSPVYILEEDTSCPASSSFYFRIDLGRKACGFPSGPTHPHIWYDLGHYQGLCHLCNPCYTWAGGNQADTILLAIWSSKSLRGCLK